MRILRFHTTIKGQFQEMQGELTLRIDKTEISGSLMIGDRQSYFQGRMLRKNRYAASLRLKTEIYEEDCDMLLRLSSADSIRGAIVGEWGNWTLEGVGLPDAAEETPGYTI